MLCKEKGIEWPPDLDNADAKAALDAAPLGTVAHRNWTCQQHEFDRSRLAPEALRELEEQLLPGPLRDHLGHVCGAVDAERLLPGRQGTEQSGWALVAANERLVLAQGAALGPALAESLDRTVILESTLHSITEQHSLSDDYAVDAIDDQRGATP